MRTFETGMKRKAQFLDKAKKDRLRVANGLLRSFCKGWGESAKQGVSLQSKGAVKSQGRGGNAKGFRKVGSKRKWILSHAKGRAKLVLMHRIF